MPQVLAELTGKGSELCRGSLGIRHVGDLVVCKWRLFLFCPYVGFFLALLL